LVGLALCMALALSLDCMCTHSTASSRLEVKSALEGPADAPEDCPEAPG